MKLTLISHVSICIHILLYAWIIYTHTHTHIQFLNMSILYTTIQTPNGSVKCHPSVFTSLWRPSSCQTRTVALLLSWVPPLYRCHVGFTWVSRHWEVIYAYNTVKTRIQKPAETILSLWHAAFTNSKLSWGCFKTKISLSSTIDTLNCFVALYFHLSPILSWNKGIWHDRQICSQLSSL